MELNKLIYDYFRTVIYLHSKLYPIWAGYGVIDNRISWFTIDGYTAHVTSIDKTKEDRCIDVSLLDYKYGSAGTTFKYIKGNSLECKILSKDEFLKNTFFINKCISIFRPYHKFYFGDEHVSANWYRPSDNCYTDYE